MFAKAVDTLAEAVGPEARQAVLARETKVTHHDVKTLAKVATQHALTAKAALEAVKEARTPKQARRIVREAAHQTRTHAAWMDSMIRSHVPEDEWPARLQPKRTPAHQRGRLVLEPEEPDEMPTTATWPQAVSSGDYEWYTPPEVLNLVRQVLETIDVDPASCAAAQEQVGATTYYTAETDGLRQPWHGRVFCNPPYKMPEVARFCGKLREEIVAGHTTEAIVLVNATTETDWFQDLAAGADLLCFVDGRIRFQHATRNGDRPCVGSAVCYFGRQGHRFATVFAALGIVLEVVAHKSDPQLPLAATPAPPPPADPLPQDAPITRASAGSLKEAVYLTVQRLQPCANAQVAQALGERRNTVYRALQALVEQGKVRQEGQQYWVTDVAGQESTPHA